MLTLFIQDTHFGDICKQSRTVQFPQNVASDPGLHYLLTEISPNTVKAKILTRNPKTSNGLIQIIRMDNSTSQKRVKLQK